MSDVTPKKIPAPATPAAEPLEEAAAAIVEEIISKDVRDLVMTATPDDLRGPDHASDATRGNTSFAHVWVLAPATMKLSSLTCRRLLKIAPLLGIKNTEISFMQAKFIGDSKVLLLRPAPDSDRTAYELHRYKGRAGVWCNLFDLMGSHHVTVATGCRERYDVVYVPRESALWPGLLVDLGTPKERRMASKKKHATAQAKQDKDQAAPETPSVPTSTETSA